MAAQGSESGSEDEWDEEMEDVLEPEDELKVAECKELFKDRLAFYVLRTQRFVCPLCPGQKKDDYKYNEILRHAMDRAKRGGVKGKQHRLLLQRLKDPDVRPAFGESGTAQPSSGDHIAQMLPGVPEVHQTLTITRSMGLSCIFPLGSP